MRTDESIAEYRLGWCVKTKWSSTLKKHRYVNGLSKPHSAYVGQGNRYGTEHCQYRTPWESTTGDPGEKGEEGAVLGQDHTALDMLFVTPVHIIYVQMGLIPTLFALFLNIHVLLISCLFIIKSMYCHNSFIENRTFHLLVLLYSLIQEILINCILHILMMY